MYWSLICCRVKKPVNCLKMLIIVSEFVCYKSFFVVPRIKTHIISNHKHVAVTTFVVRKSLTTNINSGVMSLKCW